MEVPVDESQPRSTRELGDRPRRRLRDRLVAHETQNRRLADAGQVSNLLLLIDDDLRETAVAMSGIEGFLAEALRLLDDEEVRAHELIRLCADDRVMEKMDTLAETLTTLRRRFGALAATIR
jgi:hypothetical protein